jgi:hypothetical protein
MKACSRLRLMTSGLGSQMTSPMTTGCISPGFYRLPSGRLGGAISEGSSTQPRIPADFAAELAALVDPGDAEDFGLVLERAVTELDDVHLADLLEALASRIQQSAEPLRVAELQALLVAVRTG